MFDDEDEQQPKTKLSFKVPTSVATRVARLLAPSGKASTEKARAMAENRLAADLLRTGVALTEYYRKHAATLRRKRRSEESLRAFLLRLVEAGCNALPDADEEL